MQAIPGLRRLAGAFAHRHWVLYALAVWLMALLYRRLLRQLGLLESSYTKAIRGKVVLLSEQENQAAAGIIEPSQLTETLDQVGGLRSAKTIVRDSIVAPLAAPHLYPPGSLRAPPKGVLLHGPPGTGKTLLARTIAKEANATFIEARLDSILMKYVGESEKHVAGLFSLARKVQPAIIFVDEIDGLLCDRDSSSSSAATFNLIKTVFMTEWDGLTTSNETVLVIGATNRPAAIDDAALRRMPVKLKVDFPELEARMEILRIILSKDPSISADSVAKLPFARIARCCDGYSGSDLRELCKEAALASVRACPPAPGDPLSVDFNHFSDAMKVIGSNQKFVARQHQPSPMDFFKALNGTSNGNGRHGLD